MISICFTSLKLTQFAHCDLQVDGLPVSMISVLLYSLSECEFYFHSTLIDGGRILEHFQDVLILWPFLHRNDDFISFYDLGTIKPHASISRRT